MNNIYKTINSPVKILHIVPTYFPAHRYGGPIKSVHELNKWLVKKGVDVTVYTTDINGPENLNVSLGKPVNIDGVKVYYFKNSFPRFWFYSRALHKALVQNVRKFDLIHITSVFLSVSTLGAYYAKKFRKPYIISPRGSLMKEPLEKKSRFKKKIYLYLIEKRNLGGASAIHFTADLEKEEYLKAGLPLAKSIIIPNGLDIEEFREKVPLGFFRKKFGIAPDKKLILFFSRLSWKKGLDTLIPAFAEILKKEPGAILAIAGGDDEGYAKNVRLLISNFQLEGKVIFTGIIIGQDKIAAFQDSNVFVLPSYSENFGIAAVEAMHFGLPVVITKNVGISPDVIKARAGLVIDKNAGQLTEAILKIINNPDLAGDLAKAGKQLIKSEFSWPEIAEKFMEEYNGLIINNQNEASN